MIRCFCVETTAGCRFLLSPRFRFHSLTRPWRLLFECADNAACGSSVSSPCAPHPRKRRGPLSKEGGLRAYGHEKRPGELDYSLSRLLQAALRGLQGGMAAPSGPISPTCPRCPARCTRELTTRVHPADGMQEDQNPWASVQRKSMVSRAQ